MKSRSAFLAAACAVLSMWAANAAAIDVLWLKDARLLTGRLVRHEATYLQFRVEFGGIPTTMTFPLNEVELVSQYDAELAPPRDPPSDPMDPWASPRLPGPGMATATRTAMLNFGPTEAMGRDLGDGVGAEILAQTFRDAIPLLEADAVQVVIIRVNSGGGVVGEAFRIQDVFEHEYKPRFRTTAIIENAIHAASMAVYPIEELYFASARGSLGACIAWGPLVPEHVARMELVSRWAKRSPFIMQSMQVLAPLSATIDERTGEVHWFKDTTGEIQVNPANQILTLTGQQAVRLKFAKGIAESKEELVRLMGIQEVVWAGESASRLVNDRLRAADACRKRWDAATERYITHIQTASHQQDRQKRSLLLAKARQDLKQLREMCAENPTLAAMAGVDAAFFVAQEQHLGDLEQ